MRSEAVLDLQHTGGINVIKTVSMKWREAVQTSNKLEFSLRMNSPWLRNERRHVPTMSWRCRQTRCHAEGMDALFMSTMHCGAVRVDSEDSIVLHGE